MNLHPLYFCCSIEPSPDPSSTPVGGDFSYGGGKAADVGVGEEPEAESEVLMPSLQPGVTVEVFEDYSSESAGGR